jgi:RND family efflux transporter MFP subunit
MPTAFIFQKCRWSDGIFIACLLLASCSPSAPPAPASTGGSAPIAVEFVTPRRAAITRQLILPGEIKPYQEAALFAKVSGYLKGIPVDKGDHVRKGDLLAEIEVPEIMADRSRSKAELAIAETEYNRLSGSRAKSPDLVTLQSVDEANARFEIAKAVLEKNEALLNFAKITAPFSGIVSRRAADPGAFIPAATATTSQGAGILTVTDLSRVRVQAAVPEIEVSHVRTNLPVKITIESLPGAAFPGVVTRFTSVLDDRNKTMLVEIELPNPEFKLMAGMFATVSIGIERRENALTVPLDAMLQEKSGASVFTISDNKAVKTPVKLGFTDSTQAEIVSGIQETDKVILLKGKSLTNGQAIKGEGPL